MRPSGILLIGLLLGAAGLARDARNVLVVVNENSPDSVLIGEYYQRKRGLPPANVCRISVPVEPTISRENYDRHIRDAVAGHLLASALQDQILYIVTTLGVPLVIDGDGGSVGDLASVDSELSLLYRHMVYGEQTRFGRTDNPYFAVELRPRTARPFLREKQETYLVTRLAGTTAVDAVLLVDRAMEPAGKEGRFYFDFDAQQRSLADGWMHEAARLLQSAGRSVELEESRNVFAELRGTAGFATAHRNDPLPETIQWEAGGVALILGRPLDEHPETLSLIRQGATGVVTTVGDPGGDGYIWPQIFFAAYLSGHNLAESAGLASRYCSWRGVVIGDPLARPWQAAAAMPPGFLGAPEIFKSRRIARLREKHGSRQEALEKLLQAESLAAGHQWESARTQVEDSLAVDPLLPEAHLLLAQLLDRAGNAEAAFEHYGRVLELTHDRRDLHLRRAQLALDGLDDGEAAEPHARWLFARFGLADPEVTRLWAEVRRRKGEIKEAEALYFRLTRGVERPPAFALLALADLALEQGEPLAARDFLSRALETEDLPEPEAVEARLRSLEQAAVEGEAESPSAAPSSEPVSGDTVSQDFPSRPARVVYQVQPEYPLRAVEKGQQGRVVLRLLVDERGQLLKSKVVVGEKRLADAVLKTLPEWQFEPQLINGRPVVGWVTVAVIFRIDQKKP